MSKDKDYPQPYSCKGKDSRLSQKIHNAIKHGETPKSWWFKE